MEIYAHRGFSSQAPENTLSALRMALGLEIDGIEFDVQMTKDKKLVIIHDEKLKRTTNGRGLVEQKSYKELNKLSAGSWFSNKYKDEKIPLLSQVLELLKNKDIKINIELKNDKIRYIGMESMVLELINNFNLDNKIILSSFNYESLERIYELNKNIEIAYLSKKIKKDIIYNIKRINAKAIHTKISKLNKKQVKAFHEENIKVRCYTINKKRHFKKAIKYGVDGLFTDKPDYILNMKGEIDE
ncbi:MAG: glycerophosphodiester phosphodiesterase [Fusobacteriota bacterium]